MVNCEIEMAGKTYPPSTITADPYARKVDGANGRAEVHLPLRQPPSPKRFRVVVTYDQPMIGNTFYYLPQFEVGPLI